MSMAKGNNTQKVSNTKTRTVKAGAPTVTPTYLPEGQTYTMGLHDIVQAVQIIEKYGHTAKFIEASKAQQVGGTFDAKAVNFVKDFMVKHEMHADPVGRHIVNAREAQPDAATLASVSGFNCNFG
jgi:hypothetical protein